MKALSAAVVGLAMLAGGASAQSFSIRDVAFNDSVYLSDAALDGVADDYTGRPITFSDLHEMVEKINALYAGAGVVTARAVLPPQEIANGVLQVRLVEATVDQVDASGLERTDEAFMLNSIRIQQGAHPDFENLERELRRFEVAHDFRPVLTFAPGEEPGTTTAKLGGVEPERSDITGSLDNFGSESTGEIRATVFGQMNSVTGVRDTLFGQLQASEGAYSGAVGYSRPVNGRGGRIIASATLAQSNVIAGPFAAVDIVSDSYSFTLGYSQPVRVRADSHWTLRGDIVYENSVSTISETDFADVNLTEVQLTGTWQRIRPRYSLAGSIGIKAGSSDSLETSETEGSYQIVFGNLSYAQQISDRAIFSGQMDFQIAPDQNLPVARLFNAGGATSLRGYPNAVRSGDSGLIARLQVSPVKEYQMPGREEGRISPFGFVDLGLVIPFREDGSINSDQDYLASIGGGIRGQFTDDLSGVLMLASPLKETLGFTDTGKAVGYIGLDYKF